MNLLERSFAVPNESRVHVPVVPRRRPIEFTDVV
jgi:hypothetical protein